MLDQFLVVVSVTAVVMVIPGPDMLLVVRNTLIEGRLAGLQTSMGILAGNLIHITYCVLGIGLIIAQSILAFSILKYLAAAYLIYLGIMAMRSGAPSLATHGVAPRRVSTRLFAQGFINNLLNPKGTLFYLGVFTTVITPDTPAGVLVLLVSAMMLVSGSFWIAFVYTLDRRTLRNFIERSQGALNRVFGALLIVLGLRVAAMSR